MPRSICAFVLAVACTRASSSIPSVDGPLELTIRYPTSTPVAVRDSVGSWGSVGSGRATLAINGRRVRVEPNGAFAVWLPVPPGPAPVLAFAATLDGRTLTGQAPIVRMSEGDSAPDQPRPAAGWVRVRRLPSDTADSATQKRPVASRWFPGGPPALPLPLGTRLPVDARTGDAVRLRLAEAVRVWVSVAEVDTVAPARPDPVSLGAMTLAEGDGHVEISVPVGEPLASAVDVVGTRVRWSIFGARHASDVVSPAPLHGYVRAARRPNGPAGRADLELRLAAPPAGWRTAWTGGRLMLELRTPRAAGKGLTDLVVALDAGHPPAGATGPTGLREDSVTLAVAQATARALARLGARPFLVRQDARPLSLEARIATAEAANAQVYVSIHLDAPRDGYPPQKADGTQTFYAQPLAEPLAQALLYSMSRATRQHSRRVESADLAVLRTTWFPAALIEGACLVLPEREAWLRTQAGVDAYSAGIVGGLRRWVSEAQTQHDPVSGSSR
jgi:N-acetylmuramoyl-L-alanine amidase